MIVCDLYDCVVECDCQSFAGSSVPADAVLLFDLELVELHDGVPPGFLFVWLDEIPDPLFSFMDLNHDEKVPEHEVPDHGHI